MSVKQAINSLAVLGATSAILMAAPVHAADPAERTPSVMNQASVYETTLKFYLHPARLEVIETPREKMDHPAVIVARRQPAGFDWTSAFILHPARLAVAPEGPQPTMDQPAVTTVAKTKHVPNVYKTRFVVSTPGK